MFKLLLAKKQSKGTVTLADIRWWFGGCPLVDYHDKKDLSLGPLAVRRISARIFASLAEP
jgi:hypothetical protein